MEELLELVGAMRSLASMHVHAAIHALEAVRRYAEAMAEAIRNALRLTVDQNSSAPDERGRSSHPDRALLLCMSEHGFVGGFNDRLLQAAAADHTLSDALLVLGSRGAALAFDHGYRPHWQHPMPTRLASIPEVVRLCEAQIYSLIAGARVSRAEVIYASLQHSGALTVKRRQLFPLELPAGTATAASLPPLHNLDRKSVV